MIFLYDCTDGHDSLDLQHNTMCYDINMAYKCTGKPGGTNKDPHDPNSSGYKRNASTFLDMVITTSFAARARLGAQY